MDSTSTNFFDFSDLSSYLSQQSWRDNPGCSVEPAETEQLKQAGIDPAPSLIIRLNKHFDQHKKKIRYFKHWLRYFPTEVETSSASLFTRKLGKTTVDKPSEKPNQNILHRRKQKAAQKKLKFFCNC